MTESNDQRDERFLTVPHRKLHSAPLKWGGLDVRFDPELPQDAVELRDANGKVLIRATVPNLPHPSYLKP